LQATLPMIKQEIAKVQAEIRVFRRDYLPVLAPRVPIDSRWTYVGQRIGENWRPIQAWHEAIAVLSDALPLPTPARPLEYLNREALADFLVPATSNVRVRPEGFDWEITIFATLNPCVKVRENLPQFDGYERVLAALEQGNEADLLTALKEWVVQQPGRRLSDWNLFGRGLPAIAYRDPGFAASILSREPAPHWRCSAAEAESDLAGCAPEEHSAEVFFLRHILHNTLLHVLAAVANNHFDWIRQFLQSPYLLGSYTELMPAYLFTTLHEKVGLMRQLCGDLI